MKQIWITKTGAPEVLKVKEAEDPVTGPGKLRVRVKASGINFADILARMGLYPDSPKLPTVVGYEVSGEVEEIGEGTNGFKVGDKVIGLCRFGGYSDKVVLGPDQLYHLPEGMSFSQGATIPVNYLTVYQMLFGMGAIQPGDKILVHSAAGGIGLAAIDLIQLAGAEVIGTASKSKHEFLRNRGVKHLIDYRNEDFEEAVKDITKGRGVQLILDPIGGDYWAKGLRCLSRTGRLAVFGFSSAASGKKRSLINTFRNLFSVPWLKINPISLMNGNKGIIGINLGHMWGEQDRIRKWGNQILKWYGEGKVHPTVAKEFSFEEAAAAHHYIQDRKNIGKVLLVP